MSEESACGQESVLDEPAEGVHNIVKKIHEDDA